jgi:hypothetical protein
MLIVDRDGSFRCETRTIGRVWRLERISAMFRQTMAQLTVWIGPVVSAVYDRWLVQRLKRAIQLYTAQVVTYYQPACGC